MNLDLGKVFDNRHPITLSDSMSQKGARHNLHEGTFRSVRRRFFMPSHSCAELENQARAVRTTYYYTINVPSNATRRQSPNQIGVGHF